MAKVKQGIILRAKAKNKKAKYKMRFSYGQTMRASNGNAINSLSYSKTISKTPNLTY